MSIRQMNPPFFLDLPSKECQPQPMVLAQYTANSPVAMASQYIPQLRRYKAIVMDIGLQDGLIRGNEALHQALERGGVQHRYETYEGDHGNRIAERVEKLVLPFFGQQLSAR
jgi:hypothetical protein